jgi:Sec-independent protein translocase protein TatA
MKISVERLRNLARRKGEAYGAMREAWQGVQFAQKELRAAKAAKDEHVDYYGGKRDPETDKPFDAAIASAAERLRRCEEEHDRLHDEWEAAGRLARRGYEYARQHTTIPADISEAFQ